MVEEVSPLDDFQLVLNTIKNEGVEEEDTTREEVNGPDILYEMGRLIATRTDIFEPVEPEDLQQQQNSLNDVGGAQEPDSGPSPKKRYPCQKVNGGRTFKFKGCLKNHLRGGHKPPHAKPPPPKQFGCPFVGCKKKRYNSKQTLLYHLESQHWRTNYICGGCDKGYAGNGSLKKHHKRKSSCKKAHAERNG